MSETVALAIIPAGSLPTIIAADTNDVLGKLAAELADFEADITTPKGRAEIASKARKVATAKMDLIRLGKSLTEGWRDQTKAVNAECKVIEERMDFLRDQVRAPLDEYEDREKRRVEGHEAAIADFTFIVGAVAGLPSSQEVLNAIDQVTDMHDGRDWEEFAGKAHKERQHTLETMRAVYQTARTREDEAEAARIAAEEQAEREREAAVLAQIAREERIAAEAADRAKLAAEAEAARQAREAEERAQAALKAAEAMRRHQEEVAAEALGRSEREKQEAIERQHMIEERERLAAEQAEAAREAAARQAERDRVAAIEAERQRVAAEAERQRIEDERRAADKAHRGKINRNARNAIEKAMNSVEGSSSDMQVTRAQAVVEAIIKGLVPHVELKY